MKCLPLAALLLVPWFAYADTFAGRVVNVHDGDTLTVQDDKLTQTKIRLAGIDAPELGQAYGKASRDNLVQLVAGKTVSIEWDKQDKYGRTVGRVMLDGKDQCLEQVHNGLAWHYKKYEKEQTPEDRQRYNEAERKAKEAMRGLWQDRDPLPPWEWRQQSKLQTSSTLEPRVRQCALLAVQFLYDGTCKVRQSNRPFTCAL